MTEPQPHQPRAHRVLALLQGPSADSVLGTAGTDLGALEELADLQGKGVEVRRGDGAVCRPHGAAARPQPLLSATCTQHRRSPSALPWLPLGPRAAALGTKGWIDAAQAQPRHRPACRPPMQLHVLRQPALGEVRAAAEAFRPTLVYVYGGAGAAAKQDVDRATLGGLVDGERGGCAFRRACLLPWPAGRMLPHLCPTGVPSCPNPLMLPQRPRPLRRGRPGRRSRGAAAGGGAGGAAARGALPRF